ncbi:MAG: hypothetical protein HZA35_02275 [Parcubacteria group bacterium]|nr:hypothetical protein [Parcubacteria group bacterium]
MNCVQFMFLLVNLMVRPEALGLLLRHGVGGLFRYGIEEMLERYPNIDTLGDTMEFDTFLLQHSAVVPNAFLGLRRLIESKGVDRVWIVSRAEGIERVVNRRLFIAYHFEELTGMPMDHIHFVDKREEKAPVCRRLGIEGHIDDRGEVLFHLLAVVPNLIWFSPTVNGVLRWSYNLSGFTCRVSGWDEILLKM